jgi:prevent-host-death family protein
MANKNINVNELQSQISKVLKDAQAGEVYEVMRYSEPIAVVLSYNKYLSLRGECKRCIDDLRKLVKEETK